MKYLGEILFFSILFCVSISLLFSGSSRIHMMHRAVKNQIHHEAAYVAKRENDSLFVVKRDEIIAYLNRDFIEYDVMVDGYTIVKEKHNKYNIEYEKINQAAYIKQYQYDEDGHIRLILYTSISEMMYLKRNGRVCK